MLDAQPLPRCREFGHVLADAALDPQPGGDARRGQDADGGVAADRDEGAGHDRAAVRGRGQQAELGHGGALDLAEAHQRACRQADFTEPVGECRILLQVLRGLVTGDLQGGGGDQYGRHPVVHAGHRGTGDGVADVPGGQQRAAARRELDGHGRGGSRHAGDLGGAGVVDPSARGGEGRGGEVPGVEHADPYGGLGVRRGDEAALDGEGSDADEQVAAVLTVGHLARLDADLEEQIVDVRLGTGRGRHHGHLAGQGVRPAEPVDLARIGAAHDAQQQVVAYGGLGGQVAGQEVGALGGAAAHQHAAHLLGAAVHNPASSRA